MDQKKSKEYWEKRARENENKVYKKASDLKKELDVHYVQAKREIQKSINDLIARYMFKTDLSYADAMKYLTSKEFKEFRMSLEEYEAEIERLSAINEELANKLRIELETLAMKSRITRLDSLKTQIDIELSKKISKDYNVVEKGISEVYRDFFKIQTTDFGLTGVNTVLPKKTLKMLMQQPWSGANFSERIWGNSEALGKVLKQEIIQSFMQGVSVKDLSDRIEKRFENDRYNTERLVRTELNYAFNQTTKLSYEEAEIEEYEFLAEIDSRTSEICKKLNGEKFKVKDARAGVNYPPMHPHCRSTTVAVLDFDNFGKEKDSFEKHKIVDRESATSKWKRRKEFENEIEDIINYQGFDGLPRIVKKDEFEKLVQEDHFLAKRSYSANSSDQMEERKNELYYGKWYVTCSVGGAQYGQGMYCAADYTKGTKIKELTEEMEHYTSLNKRRGSPFYRVETLTLDKSAKILDFNSYEKCDRLKLISCLARRYVEINSKFFGIDKRYFDKTLPEELLKENEDIYFNVWNKISDDMFKKRRDIGAVAAELGYDAINAKGHGATNSYTIILNRTKLIILSDE